jgi:type IV pilus assembly protein PilX
MNMFVQQQSQRGAALIVCLVLLLGITAVGIAGMKETVTQQQVVNAVTEDDTAFQAAEFALRQGEEFIFGYTSGQGGKLGPGVATLGGVTVTVLDETEDQVAAQIGGTALGADMADNWWKDEDSAIWDFGAQVTNYPRITDVHQNTEAQRYPSFIIEVLARGSSTGGPVGMEDDNQKMNYRITARGFGVNDAYYVVLQTTYSVQL